MPTLYQQPQDPPKTKRRHAPATPVAAPAQKTVRAVQAEPPPHRHVLKLMDSYAVKPAGIRFDTQEEEEEVRLFLRQHPILVIPWLVFAGVLMLVPLVLFPALLSAMPPSLAIPPGYVVVVSAFWYVAVFGFALSQILHWHFNIFIVTDRRIIDIDFVNLLYRKFAETQLIRVQDISYKTGGFLATFFNYGDVHIQTAGENPSFVFESVPKPNEVVDVISDLVKEVGSV